MARKYGSQNSSAYGLNGRTPPPHAKSFAALKAKIAAAPLPTSSDNLGKGVVPEVMDQGQTSSCTGHGSSGALAMSAASAGVRFGFEPAVPSPRGIYTLGRRYGSGGSPMPLEDNGADPAMVYVGIEMYGVRASEAPVEKDPADPYGASRNSDCSTLNVNDEPTLLEMEKDLQAIIVGPHVITTSGHALVLDICTALAAGYGVAMGIFVDTEGPLSVEGWDPSSGPLGAPVHPTDPEGGGHWIYIYDYYTDSSGNTVFQWRNSWGTGWGKSGDGLGSAAFVTNDQAGPFIVSEVTAIQKTVAEAV